MFDGSGNYIRIHNWQLDAANGLNISAPEMDGEDNSIQAAFNLCVTRDGQGKMAADFVPTVDNTYNLGTNLKRWASINGVAVPTTGPNIGALIFAATPIEIAASTPITNFTYPPYDPRRYGADQIGVADSTTAFNASPNVTIVEPGTYKTNTAVTAGKPIVSFNASFTGTVPINNWMPNFGANDFTVMEFLGGNAIVGAVQNNLGAVALSGVAITGAAGQFSCTAASLAVGMFVFIQGTLGGTGSITGYTNPTQYKISATNGSTTFTLTTLAAIALVTTAGTPAGLTYTTSPAAGTVNFPTGTTGYARINTAGNSAFGLFGQADLWATGNAIGAEIDSFNYAGTPADVWPANLGFGTTGFNAIQSLLAPYGNFNSVAGSYYAQGAQQNLANIYMHPYSSSLYGLFIDASTTTPFGPNTPALIRGYTNFINLTLQTFGTLNASNAVFQVLDQSNGQHMAINQDGSYRIGGVQVLGARITGYGTPTGGAKQVSFAAGAITLPNLAAAVAQLIVDLKTHGMIGA